MSDYSKAKEEYDAIVSREEHLEELNLRIENLSAIIRRMNRYINSNTPAIACSKIQTLFDKSKHLLSETKITRLKR